jgi:glucosylglycerate phosphorylase
MDVIQGLLKEIYNGKLTPVLLDDLITRIEVARNQISYTAKQGWDEKDVVLITYADQFTNKEEKTLSVFDGFYQQHLADIFNIVHLLPFYPYSSDDGFSVIDYRRSIRWRGTGKISVSSACLHG